MSDLALALPPGWMEIKDSATGQTLYFNKQTGITLNERPGTSKASAAPSKFSVAQSGASFASQPSVMPQQPTSQQFGAANVNYFGEVTSGSGSAVHQQVPSQMKVNQPVVQGGPPPLRPGPPGIRPPPTGAGSSGSVNPTMEAQNPYISGMNPYSDMGGQQEYQGQRGFNMPPTESGISKYNEHQTSQTHHQQSTFNIPASKPQAEAQSHKIKFAKSCKFNPTWTA